MRFLCVLVLIVAAAMTASPAFCQERKHDVITLRDSSKIEAYIQEVEAIVIRYKKRSDPEGPVFIINKAEVAEILFGNGEREVFEAVVERYFEPVQSPPRATEKTPVYNAPKPRNKFEELMYTWDATKLRAAHKHFKGKSKSGFITGITFSSLGFIGMIAGAAIIVDNVDATTGVILDESKANTGAVLMVGGLLVGASLGTIGFVTGGRNASKAKKIARELRRRNEPLVGFRFTPSYNPVTRSGHLSVRMEF